MRRRKRLRIIRQRCRSLAKVGIVQIRHRLLGRCICRVEHLSGLAAPLGVHLRHELSLAHGMVMVVGAVFVRCRGRSLAAGESIGSRGDAARRGRYLWLLMLLTGRLASRTPRLRIGATCWRRHNGRHTCRRSGRRTGECARQRRRCGHRRVARAYAADVVRITCLKLGRFIGTDARRAIVCR